MWPRLASLALGIWLMAAPALLDYDDPARASDRIVGPIVASVAFVAVWEVARALRWVNAGFGFWLLLAPWVLDHGPAATANSLAVGMLLLALAAVRGSMRRRFGGGLQYPRPRPPRRPRSPARVPGSPRLRRPDRDERLPITVSLLLVVRTQSAGAMTAEVFDQFLRRRVKPTSRSTSVPQAA